MLDRDPLPPTWRNRLYSELLTVTGELVRWSWRVVCAAGAIGPRTPTARRFGSFGDGTIVCFPFGSHVNLHAIHLGAGTVVNPGVTLSAGWMPDQPGLASRVLSIGDRCLIGRGSSIVAHQSIEIGDDVWTGHHVHITDMNHGYEDLSVPISRQYQPEAPVTIGDGSWLGHGVVVLPGARIGRHVVVGANSVVTGDLPDHSVAVGAPARVIKRLVPDGPTGAHGAEPEWRREPVAD
ncbi:acyltransferase [Rhabdothermincola sp.]|uniref:acyltransferase n=1 Tax=Rhabdothermincola sp. TaxID=2820405 RepID=UPI002FE058A5